MNRHDRCITKYLPTPENFSWFNSSDIQTQSRSKVIDKLLFDAISSSPHNRLKLYQIFDWILKQNPYLKSDKMTNNGLFVWQEAVALYLYCESELFLCSPNECLAEDPWWMIKPFILLNPKQKSEITWLHRNSFSPPIIRTLKTHTLPNSKSIYASSHNIKAEPLSPRNFITPPKIPKKSLEDSSYNSPYERLLPNYPVPERSTSNYSINYTPNWISNETKHSLESHYLGLPKTPSPDTPTWGSHPVQILSHCGSKYRMQQKCYTSPTNGMSSMGIPTTKTQVDNTELVKIEATSPNQNFYCLSDLKINEGGLDCNVEKIIEYEMNIDGDLSFNFQNEPHQDFTRKSKNSGGLLPSVVESFILDYHYDYSFSKNSEKKIFEELKLTTLIYT